VWLSVRSLIWQALATLYAALSKDGRTTQLKDFFSADVKYDDLISGATESGPAAVVEALRLHPTFISDQLPSRLPRLELNVESVADKPRSAVVEWQAKLGGVTVPLGRGLTLVDFDERGKVSRIINVAEAPWKAMGRVVVAASNMAGAASKWLKGARKIASDALCDLVDECTVEDKAVLSVSAGMLVDTMNSGVGDALLVDATGEGRASKLIHLHKEQAKLSRLDAHPTAPTQPRTSKAAVTMIAAPAALRRAVPETAGGEAILGFYDAFNLRDLDGLGQFITGNPFPSRFLRSCLPSSRAREYARMLFLASQPGRKWTQCNQAT
jgi:hypothetical protein